MNTPESQKRFDEWKTKETLERTIEGEITAQFLALRNEISTRKTLSAKSKLDGDIFPEGQWFKDLGNLEIYLPLSQEAQALKVDPAKVRKGLLSRLGFTDSEGRFGEAGVDLLKVQEERQDEGNKTRFFFTQSPKAPNVMLSYAVREHKNNEDKVMFFIVSEFLEYTKNTQGYAAELKKHYIQPPPKQKAIYL